MPFWQISSFGLPTIQIYHLCTSCYSVPRSPSPTNRMNRTAIYQSSKFTSPHRLSIHSAYKSPMLTNSQSLPNPNTYLSPKHTNSQRLPTLNICYAHVYSYIQTLCMYACLYRMGLNSRLRDLGNGFLKHSALIRVTQTRTHRHPIPSQRNSSNNKHHLKKN